MNGDYRKMRSCGFSLVEVMLVIIFIAILAGMSVLAMGSGTDGTEAAAIMSHLDSAKNAMLAYSQEHRTRNSNPLQQFVGATSALINTSLDRYLEGSSKTGGSAHQYYSKLSVRRDSNNVIEVGFNGFLTTSGIARALDNKIHVNDGLYTGSGNASSYSVWLKIK
jgi:type II secretory pathway pseudopilin PulG